MSVKWIVPSSYRMASRCWICSCKRIKWNNVAVRNCTVLAIRDWHGQLRFFVWFVTACFTYRKHGYLDSMTTFLSDKGLRERDGRRIPSRSTRYCREVQNTISPCRTRSKQSFSSDKQRKKRRNIMSDFAEGKNFE